MNINDVLMRLWFLPKGATSGSGSKDERVGTIATALDIRATNEKFHGRPMHLLGDGNWKPLETLDPGPFLGVQIFQFDELSADKSVCLEVPGEEVWSRVHANQLQTLPATSKPDDAKSGIDSSIIDETNDSTRRGGQAERISPGAINVPITGYQEKETIKSGPSVDFWLRIPSFLLPLRAEVPGRNDGRHGDHAWLAISLRFDADGGPSFSLGLAAGAETTARDENEEPGRWPKQRFYSPNPASLQGRDGEASSFMTAYSMPRSGAYFPGPPAASPLPFLTSACERILGLKTGGQPRAGDVSGAALTAEWSTRIAVAGPEKAANPNCRYLILRRTFGSTHTAADPFLRHISGLEFSRADFASDKSADELRRKLLPPAGVPADVLKFVESHRDLHFWSRDAVSEYIWKSLSSRSQGDLDSSGTDAKHLSVLIDALNDLIQGPSIYDRDRFTTVKLSAATRELASKLPTGSELVRLNRLLLMEAYPGIFAQPHADFQKVVLEQRSRSLLEIAQNPAFHARKWYLQMRDDNTPTDLRLSARRFRSGWDALMRSWSPNITVSSTALFYLEPQNTPVGAFPRFDLATKFEVPDDGIPGQTLNESGRILFRVEPAPPLTLQRSQPQLFTLSFQGFRTYSDKPLELQGTVVFSVPGPPPATTPIDCQPSGIDDHWLNVTITFSDESKRQPPVRFGALDICPAVNANGLPPAHATFRFNRSPSSANQWDCLAPLLLTRYEIGSVAVAVAERIGILTTEFDLPVNRILPGGTDLTALEPQSSAPDSQPLLIFDPAIAWTDTVLRFQLAISESAGLQRNQNLKLRLELARNPLPSIFPDLRVLYLDRTPFFVCLLDLASPEKIDPKIGANLAYWTPDRGWQLQMSGYQFKMLLPPQGLGEAMEKGKADEGYDDVEPGDPVAFRFPPPTILELAGDQPRNYGATPWNLRMSLNSLTDSASAGMLLHSAQLEMLYGLTMKINDTGYLRMAEVFARAGMPRAEINRLPRSTDYRVFTGNDPDGTASPDFGNFCKQWQGLLRVINSRLAVYEVFDGRLADSGKGQPPELELHGGTNSKVLVAELRKAADMRTSLPAEPSTNSAPTGSNLQRFSLIDKKTYYDEIKNKNPDADWWKSTIPNYDDGLAGSFAWAFESRLMYENLWTRTDSPGNNPAVVEAVEATIARLYFSALGGSSTQQASFDKGNIVIAVSVELGSVSELRVEVIGRIARCWNRAKLVTVFRRAVLPTRQFASQQDQHYGRPMLRKVEEYVEFVEKYRLMADAGTRAADAKLPGCVKACAGDEQILVDSRWGVDVYDKDGNGLGWKVPLRKAGAPKSIYGPANVHLCFHSDPNAPDAEVRGRIENLEDVYFWWSADPNKSADTNTWLTIKGLDTVDQPLNDRANPPGDAPVDPAELAWGSMPVLPEAVGATFRIGGLKQEVHLNHQIVASGPGTDEKPVGSLLRTITIARADGAYTSPAAAKPTVDPAQHILAHAEHAFAVIEQLTKPATAGGELVTGWGDTLDQLARNNGPVANKPADVGPLARIDVDRARALLAAPISACDRLRKLGEEFDRRARRQLGRFWDKLPNQLPDPANFDTYFNTLRAAVPDVVEKTLTGPLKGNLQNALNAGDELRVAIQTWNTKVDSWLPDGRFGSSGRSTAAALKNDIGLMLHQAGQGTRVSDETAIKKFNEIARVHLQGLLLNCLDLTNYKNADVQAFLGGAFGTPDSDGVTGADRIKRGMDAIQASFGTPASADVAAMRANIGIVIAVSLTAVTFDDLKTVTEKLSAKNAFLQALDDEAVKIDAGLAAELGELAGEFSAADIEKAMNKARKILADHIEEQFKSLDPVFIEFNSARTNANKAVENFKALYKDKSEEAGKILASLNLGAPDDISTGKVVPDVIKEIKKARLGAWKKVCKEMASGSGPVAKLKVGTVVKADLDAALSLPSAKLGTMIDNISEAASREVISLAGEVNGSCAALARQLSDQGFLGKLTKGSDFLNDIKESVNVQAKGMGDRVKARLNGIRGTVQQASAAVASAEETLRALTDEKQSFLDKLKGADDDLKRDDILRGIPAFEAKVRQLGQNLQLPWLRGLAIKFDVTPILSETHRLKARLEALASKSAADRKTEITSILADVSDPAGLYELIDTMRKAIDLNALGNPQDITQTIDLITGRLTDLHNSLKKFDPSEIRNIADSAGSLRQSLQSLEDDLTNAFKQEMKGLKAKAADISSAFLADSKTLADSLKKRLDDFGTHLLAGLPDLETLEFGMADVNHLIEGQRDMLRQSLDQLGVAGAVCSAIPVGGQNAFRALRAFGQVPAVPGLDFQGMSNLGDHLDPHNTDAFIRNFESRFRSVGFSIDKISLNSLPDYRVRMPPIRGLVDRAEDALGGAVESARLKAASIKMDVRDIRKKIEADVDQLKAKIPDLKSIFPDFGGLKLEKLLGAAGVDVDQLKAKCIIRHGFDQQTMSAFVDSSVDGLQIAGTLVVFSLGPVSLQLQKVTLTSHIRVQADKQGGGVQRQSSGSLVADWQFLFSGQTLLTYQQAALTCDNGNIRMDLDPKKVRMASVLKMVSDLVSTYSTGSDDGLQAGVRLNLPTDVAGFAKLNISLPTLGEGTSCIQNLRLGLSFELGLSFPNFPSMRDAALRISAGLNLSDQSAPFMITFFILGGSGWFTLRVDYVVPFADAKPHLEVYFSVAIGAAASLALNLGFASGSAFFSLNIQIECVVGAGRSSTRFSLLLTMGGNLNFLGIIDISIVVVLGISYASGQPLKGFGSISISVKICWLFTLKLNRSFSCSIGSGSAMTSGYVPPAARPLTLPPAQADASGNPLFAGATRQTREPVFVSHRRLAGMVV